VKAAEIGSSHAAAVVDHREGAVVRVSVDANVSRAGVERIRDDLDEDCLMEIARVCVGKVLEEMEEVDSRFAHDRKVSRRDE
jgi:hypothetical protein